MCAGFQSVGVENTATMNTLPSKNLPLGSFIRIGAVCTGLFACALTQGCSMLKGQSKERTATLDKLSNADRWLVLSGDIHKGLKKEAVYVAWGAPSKTTTRQTARGPQECWTYVETFNGYGGGYYGIPRGWVHGKRGDRYSTDDFYPAPTDAQTLGGTPTTEVPVKRVVFENERVVDYVTARTQDEEDHSDDEG